MVAEGERAPDFTLPNQDGEEVRLADLRSRSVVLYFYPRADTRVSLLPARAPAE